MTEKEINEWKLKIDKMSRFEMCRLWRFAPIGSPLFDKTTPVYNHFKIRFDQLGGFTPEISKRLD